MKKNNYNYITLFTIFSVFFMYCKKDPAKASDELSLILFRANQVQVSGQALKGVIRNAQASAYKMKTNGTCNLDSVLASTQTGNSGEYTLSFSNIGEPVCVRISPLSDSAMYDEKSRKYNSWKDGSAFTTIMNPSSLQSGTRRTRSNLHITPFSRFASARISELAKSNTSMTDLASHISRGNRETVIRFGLASPFKSKGTVSDTDYPDLNELNASVNDPESQAVKQMVIFSSAISQIAYNTRDSGSEASSKDLDQVLSALEDDGKDGSYDGKKTDGSSITISGATPLILSSDPLSDNLLIAASQFLKEGGSLSFSSEGVQTTSVTTGNITQTVAVNGTGSITSSFIPPSSVPAPTIPAAPTLSYSSSSFNFTGLSAIGTVSPTSTSSFTSFSISPTLPAPLTFNTSNGNISGTAPFMAPPTPFTITATGSSGTVSVVLTIGIMPPGKRIFVTAGTIGGNWGGPVNADNFCNADGAKPPDPAFYMAMIAYSAGTRKACDNVANCAATAGSQAVNWVLQSGVTYYRPDGTLIGTANTDRIIPLPFTNSIGAAPVSAWTGLENNWRMISGTTAECSGWTSGSGNIGTVNVTSGTALNTGGPLACGSTARLYCVEQ